MRKIRVGIIGCGTIGTEIALACRKLFFKEIKIIGLCDRNASCSEALRALLRIRVKIFDMKTLIERCDVVIEAASARVSASVAKECLRKKKDVLIMSVGGLLNAPSLTRRTRRASSRVFLPSGAVCGVDGIKAASLGVIRNVSLTTRKPPKSLKGAPYLAKKGIAIDAIRKETVIFKGSAAQAVKAFPENINVSAILSLASIGAQRVRVEIVTAPFYTKNIHEVTVESDCGSIFTRTENTPSARNPKTSRLAALSAIAALRDILRNVRIGT